MEEKKRRGWRFFAVPFVLLLGVAVLVFQIMNAHDDYNTEMALAATVYKTTETMAYAVRQETILPKIDNGFLVTLVEEGEKLSAGEDYAASFPGEDSAHVYAAYLEACDEIRYYTKLAASTRSQYPDPDKLSAQAEDAVFSFASAASQADLSAAYKKAVDMRSKIISAQAVNGNEVDYSKIISDYAALSSSYLDAAGAYSTIQTNESGYYFSRIDGYENLIPYQTATEMKVDDIDRAMELTPAEPAQNAGGKLVSYFDWYLVCNIDATCMNKFHVGDMKVIDFPYSGVGSVKAEVSSINDTKDGKTAVIFRVSNMSAELGNLRKEFISIRLEEINGYKISSKSIRTRMVTPTEIETDEYGNEVEVTLPEVSEQGVLIKRNDLASFKKVDILYTGEDYCIVGNKDDDGEIKSGYIKLYDTVITDGVDLKDGMLLS